ncbi:MAG: hypothetical protein M3Y57_19620 [Acidobacteriota bacterium]|nr:hypothetical protein [Acidobacteriota bacterium]
MNWRCTARFAFCGATGLAFSAGEPIGIIASIAFPAVALNANSRREAYAAAAWYYGGASWPIIFAVRNFFGPEAGMCDGILLWLAAVLLLSLPCLALWTNRREQLVWRAPLGVLLSVMPPLGLIGWASPMSAAGYLFPGTSWIGLLAVMVAIGSMASSPRIGLPVIASVAAVANILYGGAAMQVPWAGINTHFGGISHERTGALTELNAVEAIQQQALSSAARVVVFPEAVVSNWGVATDSFWSGSLTELCKAGKTIIVGSKIETPSSAGQFAPADFAASVAILQARSSVSPTVIAPLPPASFRNVLIVRGTDTGVFEQQVPVPFGMWKPLNNHGVPLRFAGSGVLSVAGERAAVLICYEQLLIWPVLTSMLSRPTVLVAVANDYWAGGTTIPNAQMAAVRAWARLNSIPYVSATNF